MRQLGEMLMDVHSQHQNLLLQKEDFQLNTVDIIAQNTLERNAFTKAFKAYHEAETTLERLRQQISESQRNEEFMRFQLNELTEANLSEGEQEDLENESRSASHTEDIKAALYEATELLFIKEKGKFSIVKKYLEQSFDAIIIGKENQELIAQYRKAKDIRQLIPAAAPQPKHFFLLLDAFACLILLAVSSLSFFTLSKQDL